MTDTHTTHITIMLWGVTAILTGVVVGAWASEGVEGREGRSMTWAQVANSDDIEYDDSFFRNYDYEYVDASEVELPPPPQSDAPHKVERRTLGYILGSLVDGGVEEARPARSSGLSTSTPPPSSFLESIMRSIDNFVVQDLKGWSKFLTAMNARTSTPPPPTTTPRPAAIFPPQGNEELVVVMDEFGRPQVVTINDIVASLSQLDEQTITELLLGPTNPPSGPKSVPAPAKSPLPSSFINAIQDTNNRLPAHSQARTNDSPSTISPISSHTTGPSLSPISRPSIGPADTPQIITSTSGPIINPIISSTPRPRVSSTPRPRISSTPRPIISTTPRPVISSTPRPVTSSTRPPTKRPSSLISSQAPNKRPTSFPNISSIRGPNKTPNKTPIDVPNIGAILGSNFESQRDPTRGPTQLTSHDLTRSPIQSSKRGPTHTITRGTSTRSPTRRPTHTAVRGTPSRTLAETLARGNPTHSPTRTPTRDPTRTSSPSVVRATPIYIPTSVPSRIPSRPNNLPPEFLLPSASRDNVVTLSSGDSVVRPVRHTGPSKGVPPRKGQEEDEVILVRDETGAVHMVTIQDIISSLAALSPENAKDLLFGEEPAPPPATLNLLQEPQEAGTAARPQVVESVLTQYRPRRPASVQDVIAAAEAGQEPQLPRPAHGAFFVGQQNPPVPAPIPTTSRPSLEEALRQQDIPESLVQHIAAPSILRPVTNAPPVEQPPPGGFGATLRGMLSRFVGGQQPQPQQTQPVVGQLGLALPSPIHYQEGAASHPNTLQTTTKQSSGAATLPPALQHLSPAVQAALRQQADNVPTFVPPGAQHAAARSDVGPVQYISAEEHEEARPTPTLSPTVTSSKAPPLVLPPEVLKQLPPSVLNKVTKQYIEARVGGTPQGAQERDYYQPVAHYYDYEVHPPVVHFPVHPYHAPDHYHGYDDGYADYGDLAPMLDIFLLADVTKVHKVGDTNLSVKAPKVGDPSFFVDTRPKDHY